MNKLVFIVEDNPVHQKMLQVHFEQMLGNFSVQTFSNPDEIFTRLKEKPFAIVLDHYFGEKNEKTGLYYLKELKKSNSSLPVIYYTTCDDDAVRAEVMRLGAEDYIHKDSASLVRLRTALDLLQQKLSKPKGLWKKIFGRQ